MARIKSRSFTLTTGGWQVYDGPGEVLAWSVDYAAASSGAILTAYSGRDTGGLQVAAITTDTDFGLTFPFATYVAGDIVAGTSTAEAHLGWPFMDGLWINKTGDTTHTALITVYFRPLIKKTAKLKTTGAAGSATGSVTLFSGGPGRFVAYRLTPDPSTPSTADVLFKDGPDTDSTGATLLTKTNIGSTAAAITGVSSTTGHNASGTARTTAATGSYVNSGIYFTSGLSVSVAQADAHDASYTVEALIESQ